MHKVGGNSGRKSTLKVGTKLISKMILSVSRPVNKSEDLNNLKYHLILIQTHFSLFTSRRRQSLIAGEVVSIRNKGKKKALDILESKIGRESTGKVCFSIYSKF